MRFRHLISTCAAFSAFALIAAVFAPATAQTPVKPPPIKITLDGALTGANAPFVVAEDRGFYRAEGIDVSIDVNAAQPDALSRVAAGTAEITLADINAVAKFRDHTPGAPLKAVFMVYNKPPYAVIARKSRGIAHPRDLDGKRVGAPPNEMASLFLPAFAKLNDIDVTKVKIENIAAAVREPMLAAGQIDAVIGTSISAYLNLKERGVPLDDVVILQMADYGLLVYGDAIVVNSSFAAEHPEAVKKFLRAYLKGLKETLKTPARAIESVLKRNESARKDIESERLRMVIRDNILTEEVQTNGLGGVDPERLARAADLLTQSLKAKAKIEPSDLFDASFLPPVAERRIAPTKPGAG